MKEFYVYILINPITNKPFYIGKGSNGRMKMHEYFSDNNKHWNKHIENTIKKIKKQNLNIIYEKVNCKNEDDALKLEIKLIKKHGKENLCNLTDGGDGASGYKHTIKTKKLISKIQIKRFEDPLEREKVSIQSKKSMSNTKTIQKISNSLAGRKLSYETKKKMSKAKTGKGNWCYGNDSRKEYICKNCNIIFKSYRNSKFCSIDCRNNYISKNKYNKILNCKFCNKQFKSNRKSNIFCSTSCSSRYTQQKIKENKKCLL